MFQDKLTGVKVAMVRRDSYLPFEHTLMHNFDPKNQTILLVQAEVGVGILPFASMPFVGNIEVQFSRNDSKIHHLWRSSGLLDGIAEYPAMEQMLHRDDKTLLMCEFRISVLEQNPRLPGDLAYIRHPRPVHQILVLIVGPTFYQELLDFKFPPEVEAAIARETEHA